MTGLWLVRHGQTDWNIEGRWQGQSPAAPGLNEAGRAEAAAAAAQLAPVPLAALYTSDLPRARQTAAIIAAQVGRAPVVEPRWREINLGVWEGMLGIDIARQYPVELAERERDPVHSYAPGGESLAAVAGRVWAAAEAIARQWPAGEVAIVSHGVALAAVVCRALGQPLAQARQLIPGSALPQRVEWKAAGGNG